jgi:hypothetical protein
VVEHLLPAGAPITVAVDDTLFRRRGKKVLIFSSLSDHGCELGGRVEDGVFDVTIASG